MDLRLLDLVAALARFRHVAHDAGKERPLRVADEDALEIDVIVSEKDLVRDLCLVLADHLHEVVLIHDARHRVADDICRILDAENLAGSLVDLLDLQLLADGDDAFRRDVDDLLGVGLGTLFHIWHAHADLSAALIDGDGLVAAGAVAAQAAVELIRRTEFAHFAQNPVNNRVWR